MRKITYIIILLFAGCSVIKKQEYISLLHDKQVDINIETIESRNLSAIDFSIQKIEIIISEDGKKQRLLGNVRYKKPGTYLISLRDNSGIEGMRIYIDKDTVLANDRINKKIYYGSSDQLSEKYGIKMEYMPVVFGDIVVEKSIMEKEIKCEQDLANIVYTVEKGEIKYTADCRMGKIINTELNRGTNSDKNKIYMSFKNFRKLENIIYPEIIKINDSANKTYLYIEIKQADRYEGPDLKFIPGNNYEAILLK